MRNAKNVKPLVKSASSGCAGNPRHGCPTLNNPAGSPSNQLERCHGPRIYLKTMKTSTMSKWPLGFALVVIALVAGCVRESVGSAPAVVTNDNQGPAVIAVPAPEAAQQELANAPARVVSTPQPAAQGVSLDPSSAELVRLAQSGVDENVMLAYVNNSNQGFSLGPDQIIYLNDIGVPGSVVTAMIQRDQSLKIATAASPAAAPAQVYQPAPPPPAPAPEIAPAQPAMAVAEDAPAPQVNVTATYFYDSLSPYGSWIEVEGYGRCWQPSAVVVDRGWTPYVDRGHWVYSDCGWYWSSDYSWGWAPFHYGRWFRHGYWGWCWAPDTIWGPSWVSWRYNSGYCGWAPLPPTACYRPGAGFTYYGRSVGVSFGFGLGADCFTFVAADRFCDPRPYQHRIPHHQVTQIFNNTVIINPVVEDRGNPRFHRGIPTKHIAEATHLEIKPVKIQETPNRPGPGRGEKHDRNQGTLTVFQPSLPQPPARQPGNRIGEGVKAATPATAIGRFDSDSKMHRGIPGKVTSPGNANLPAPERRIETVPVSRGQIDLPKPANPQTSRPTEPVRTEPVFGNNPRRGTRETGNVSSAPAPALEMKKEVPLNSLISRGNSGAAATPRNPAVQNNYSLPRPAPVTVPQAVNEPRKSEQVQPRHEQPFVQPAGTQYRQPRGEKFTPTPVVPAPPVQNSPPPQNRTYQMPAPTLPPQTSVKESRGSYNSAFEHAAPARIPQPVAPAAPRVAIPQFSPPRAEAPQAVARPAPQLQTPQSSSSRSDGSSRDKRSEGGNPPRNR